MEMAKPSIVTQKVRQAWPRMLRWCSRTRPPNARGLGKMNSDTSKSPHTICQNATMATSRIQCAWVCSACHEALSLFADLHALLFSAPMWPRSSCTMSVNSGV